MRLRCATKRWTMRLLLAAAIASAALFGVSLVRHLSLAPYVGLFISAQRGMLRINAFDPYVWGIRYPRGFSSEAADGTIAWKPLIFKSEDPGFTNVNVDVPLWGISALFLGAWVIARHRGWAYLPWQCRGCGYDVRGLGRPVCPECGRPVPPPEA